MSCYFRQISCSLARDPVLVHSLLAQRPLISPKLKHRTDGQVQELCGAVRHLDVHSTPFEPFAQLRNLLLVKSLAQLLLPRRPRLHYSPPPASPPPRSLT